MDSGFRKTRRVFNEIGHAHFLTYSCRNRWPLLSKDSSRQWVVDAMRHAREQLQVDLWAYVIMPEHVHLLVHPRHDDYDVSHLLAALKRPVSARAKEHLVATGNHEWLERLTGRHGSREVFQFWQPGGGFDANLWQEKPLYEVIEYIHHNPVRRGLVGVATDWAWSSARFWEGIRPVCLEMDAVELD